MKKLVLILLSVISLSSFAQKNDLTKNQKAELKTKKMTLILDLNTKQQSQILALNQEYAPNKENDKNEFKDLSPDEKFEIKSKILDQKIAYQNKIKTILSEEQFELWRKVKMKHHKQKRSSHKNNS